MPFYFGATAKMLEIERRIAYVARTGEPVMLEGESGTGKQALAEYLHRLHAPGSPFVRYLCSHSPFPLRAFEEALGGTLFIKHVHLMNPEDQDRILAVLEGPDARITRLLSSAAEPLDPMVAKGEFLPELFYRLSVFRIAIPPLRERACDIPDLFTLLLNQIQPDPVVRAPGRAALDFLAEYSWPGNVRELQNLARNYIMTPQLEALAAEIERRRHAVQAAGIDRERGCALKEQVRQASRRLEAEIIMRALERHRWNRRRTAENLRISYRSLLYKMKSCNIRNDMQVPPGGKA